MHNNNMVIMAVCHLPDYSGFIHSCKSFRKLTVAAGQILLVSKIDVGKKVSLVIAINQHEE